MGSADEAMRRFVELGSTAAWDGSALAEAACTSTSRVADAMASVMEAAASLGCVATALGEAVEAPAKQWQQMLGESIAAVTAATRVTSCASPAVAAAMALAAHHTGAAAPIGCVAAALGAAVEAPAKSFQQLLGESIGAVAAATRGTSYAVPAATMALAALYGADAELSRAQKALEDLGAAESLDESAEQWARYIAEQTTVAGWRGHTGSAYAAFAQAFHAYTSLELVTPYWESLPIARRIAQLKRVQQRAAWLLVTSAKRRIHDVVRQRQRARQTDDRLQLDIVTVQIAYFLNHGCHPPALRRSCETFRDAAARTC